MKQANIKRIKSKSTSLGFEANDLFEANMAHPNRNRWLSKHGTILGDFVRESLKEKKHEVCPRKYLPK
jgi:hypothetical protein